VTAALRAAGAGAALEAARALGSQSCSRTGDASSSAVFFVDR